MLALKVAVAIAIIKNKPENITSQEHAENLQRKFLSIQSQLGSKYQKAKLKILELEEQLAESSNRHTHANEVTDKDNHHIITPPPSMNNSQNQIHASIAVTYTDNKNNSRLQTASLEIESSMFFQSVVNLQTANSSLPEREDLRISAIQNIHNLSEVLSRGVTALSESCLCQAAEAISGLLHRHRWLEDCDGIMQGVCRLIETVLARMKEPSNQQQFPPHRLKRSLMQMLVTLMRASSAHLSLIILDSLMESWEEFCHDLRYSRKEGVPLDPLAFDSSFFIIRTLELTMKSWLDHCTLDPTSLHSVQERLDKSLLHLTDYFPLVAQAVWKVTAIVERILQG